MSKQLLSLTNVDSGRLVEKANRALAEANAALDENGGTAKVVIEISLKAADEEGHFRKVGSKVTLKAPAPTSREELLPVQTLKGERGIVVDTAPVPEQTSIPGVTNLAEKRSAAS